MSSEEKDPPTSEKVVTNVKEDEAKEAKKSIVAPVDSIDGDDSKKEATEKRKTAKPASVEMRDEDFVVTDTSDLALEDMLAQMEKLDSSIFRATAPKDTIAREKMSFRTNRFRFMKRAPYMDMMNITTNSFLSASSGRKQLQTHTKLFVEPISVPNLKHTGLQSALTDSVADRRMRYPKGRTRKTLRKYIQSNIDRVYEEDKRIKKSPKHRRRGRRKRSSPKTTSPSERGPRSDMGAPEQLESTWLRNYRKSKAEKDMKAREMLRHLRAIGSRSTFGME